MTLLIDIGNTTVNFGYAQNDEFSFCGFIDTKEINFENVYNVLNEVKNVDSIYLSSVVPDVEGKISNYLLEMYGAKVISVNSSFSHNFKMKIDHPNELGADLFCDLVAGYELYGKGIAIIDLGTASKVLFIDKDGVFSSCGIYVGYEMSLSLLSNKTALLPNLDKKPVKKISECHNTEDVLTSSAFYSQLDTFNGLISRFESEVGYSLKRIYTGGNARHFVKKDDIYDEFLVLKGLAVIAKNK